MEILDEVIKIWRNNEMDKYAKKADAVERVKNELADLRKENERLKGQAELSEKVIEVSIKDKLNELRAEIKRLEDNWNNINEMYNRAALLAQARYDEIMQLRSIAGDEGKSVPTAESIISKINKAIKETEMDVKDNIRCSCGSHILISIVGGLPLAIGCTNCKTIMRIDQLPEGSVNVLIDSIEQRKEPTQ